MYNNSTVWHRHQHVGHIIKNFQLLLQKPTLLSWKACTVTWASGTDLGLLGQCYVTFELGNKYFMDKFIVLQDLRRDLILGLNWQFNYKIGCNWNINKHQYMTHNNCHLCTSIPSKVTKPIFWNAGALYLQPRSVAIITVQASTELKPQAYLWV